MKARFSRTAVVALLFLTMTTTLLQAGDLMHVVRPGETLFHIAQVYRVPVDSIEQLNGISNARDLRIGTRLRIPRVYVVKKGDTLYGIARDENVPLSRLIAVNNLDNGHLILVGQTLILPQSASQTTTPPGGASPITDISAPADALSTTSAPSGTSPLPAEQISATGASSTPFWPSVGKRVFLTGKLAGGTQITGNLGEPVVAVASGRVVWVGPYRGYGRVVFVESPEGYIYVYGGNESTLVHVGEQVASGARLARMGVNPHLGRACTYFFVYRNGRPVDPATAPRG